MNPIPPFVEAIGLANPWTYIALFLAASLFMIWRLESMGRSGFEGTALGTVIMPFCSGLGNLLFVGIVHQRGVSSSEIITNAVVNNVTNLTLLIGLPAILFGLSLDPTAGSGSSADAKSRSRRSGKRRAGAGAAVAQRLNRLSLLFTLMAGLFFTGAVWILARDGRLDTADGTVLTGGFVFWICVQVFDVMKYNVQRNRSLPVSFYLDALLVILAAGFLYTSIDWLVDWLGRMEGGGGEGKLGWLSGLLMVVPNGLIAFYYAARRRAEVVYASQVGDGHICIPLCVGLAALLGPVEIPAHFETGMAMLAGAFGLHFAAVFLWKGLPRLVGWGLLAAYAVFLATGLMN